MMAAWRTANIFVGTRWSSAQTAADKNRAFTRLWSLVMEFSDVTMIDSCTESARQVLSMKSDMLFRMSEST
jgi:hypothetical protein